MSRFPEKSWLDQLAEKLNSDEVYARVARNWEGDLVFIIEPSGALESRVIYYLDLWHGTCRKIEVLAEWDQGKHAYILSAPYDNFVRVLKGEWHPMQAMLTRRLRVRGDMIYMMKNLPTVLDFVRCCQEITTSVLGDPNSTP